MAMKLRSTPASRRTKKRNGNQRDPAFREPDVLSDAELERLKSDPALRRMIQESLRDEREVHLFTWSAAKEALLTGKSAEMAAER